MMMTATERVAAAYARLRAADRPEVWIHLRDESAAAAEALEVDRRVAEGETLALAGLTVAVKDNIDVAGMPSTVGCPAFAYAPDHDAECVARLRAAGAIMIGKTNMDQFATGLVGTRSPHGAVRCAGDPELIAGGSSSGSAVAVALGICDLALGTDTAGSGRIPAAFQGVVGFKPTIGRVPTAGVVPACRSFDCVTVFAPTVADAYLAVEVMAQPTFAPPLSVVRSASVQLGVFGGEALSDLSPAYADAYARVLADVIAAGAEVVELDHVPFFAAGELLYGGAFVAERYAAVGEFIRDHPDDVDPIVAEIILAGREISAADYVADVERLDGFRAQARAELARCDALLAPTAPLQPTILEVADEPLSLNRRLGRFVSFGNVLDLCAVSVPADEADGHCFGVTLYAPAHLEALLADLGSWLAGEPAIAEPAGAEPIPGGVGADTEIELLVLGAHLRGQPLNRQLTDRGGRFITEASTAPGYRLYALDTEPPKPGLVRAPGRDGAHSGIAGELWAMPPEGLADLLAQLPPPMALGPVALLDGRTVVGFLCEPAGLTGAAEITAHGGWLAYLAAAATV